ncbi:hypothetical protein JVU11DRAFT_10708 [Chiua virens]|nr:hypothetical protein JVU11DRAFT_10708 [Chiua virens]
MLPFLRLLCGPTLTTLSAEFATDTESLAMLADLGTLCPNITDISISAASPTLSNDLENALSTSIPRWKDLKHVSCDDLTLPAMEHLGPNEEFGIIDSVLTYGQEFPFARLQYLHLYTGLLSTTTACLKGLRLALTEFRLDLFDTEDVFSDSSGLRDLFVTLTEACSHTSLAKLYICIIHPHFPSPDIVATLRDVRPVLNFANIRVVSLEGLPTLSLDDGDIAEMASAWPYVEELALSTYVNHPIASLPTFQSLIRLVCVCPKLRALSLVVDTTTLVTLPPCMVGCNVRSEILDDICLGNSPICAPVAVARMLHHLYPALKQVDLSVWNKEPLNRLPRRDRYEVYWGTVNIELQQLRGIES